MIIPTIKDLVEGLKDEIRDFTEFENLYDELRARKDLNQGLGTLVELLWCII
jgi:hypothetical protein